MTIGLHQLLGGLRATADPSRLRLLAVLVSGEFTVSELTEVLGQSQPRVSRHLKLLTDDGLLERFREQHWVYHRVPADGEGAEFARALLGLLDREDPVLALDRMRATAILAARSSSNDAATIARGATPESAQDLAQLAVAELGDRGFDSILYVGRAPAEMLLALGPRARRVLGVCDSRPEVQRARGSLHGRGLAHCVAQYGDARSLAGVSVSFDAVVMDRMLAAPASAELLLTEAARVLRPGGQLLLIEDYDALTERDSRGNPLGLLRDWIGQSGLLCTRIRPVDVGTRHLLLAHATPDRAVAAA
jgi:DNA-binding transcriptional ArsR family regulator